MKHKVNETKPEWMEIYHEGKTVGCHCKNCFTRFGKAGSLSLKQREHFGTYHFAKKNDTS